MAKNDNIPDLKALVSGMIFAADEAVTIRQIRKAMVDTADVYEEGTVKYAGTKDKQIKIVIEEIMKSLDESGVGFELVEVSGGYRYQSKVDCGPWLRFLLDVGKPNRLSRPALETLAITAYRQPCTRAEIEGVRGVAADSVIRSLMEMQLVKIVGRSELPGRPMLLGTTDSFLAHFGLKTISELPGVAELSRFPVQTQDEIGLETSTPSDSAAADKKDKPPVVDAGEEDVPPVAEKSSETTDESG